MRLGVVVRVGGVGILKVEGCQRQFLRGGSNHLLGTICIACGGKKQPSPKKKRGGGGGGADRLDLPGSASVL